MNATTVSFLRVFSIINAFLFYDLSAHTEWTIPHNEPVTIYFQGILNSQAQCAKYIGSQTLHATTGETIKATRNINGMLHPFIGVELDDVQPASCQQKTRWYHYLNPAHWITCWLYKRSIRDNAYATITVENPNPHKKISHTLARHSVSLSQISFGQERDITNHKRRWDACRQQFPGNPKILWGASRGAATTFNAFARHRTNYSNVSLVIVEGCYDTLFATISDRVHPFAKKLGLHKKLHTLIGMFTEYNPFGISPLKSVEIFPEHVPVVFVTSKADKVVPPQRTHNLANALSARGKNDVYLIELQRSTHNGYTVDDTQDMKLYQHGLHAIYKKLNLPYVPEYAQEYEGKLDQFIVKV